MAEEKESPNQPSKPRTSKLAIISFVLAVLNLPIICIVTQLPSILAFICGVIALFYIIKSKGQLKGMGMAVAGVVISATILYVAPNPKAILNFRNMRQQAHCESNLDEIGFSIAGSVYAQDYDAEPNIHPQVVSKPVNLTKLKDWCDTVKKEITRDPNILICPAVGHQKGQCSYAINKNTVGKKLDQLPADIVVLFEADLGYNGIGGPEDMVFRHPDGCGIILADGSRTFVKQEDVTTLRWTAEEKKP